MSEEDDWDIPENIPGTWGWFASWLDTPKPGENRLSLLKFYGWAGALQLVSAYRNSYSKFLYCNKLICHRETGVLIYLTHIHFEVHRDGCESWACMPMDSGKLQWSRKDYSSTPIEAQQSTRHAQQWTICPWCWNFESRDPRWNSNTKVGWKSLREEVVNKSILHVLGDHIYAIKNPELANYFYEVYGKCPVSPYQYRHCGCNKSRYWEDVMYSGELANGDYHRHRRFVKEQIRTEIQIERRFAERPPLRKSELKFFQMVNTASRLKQALTV